MYVEPMAQTMATKMVTKPEIEKVTTVKSTDGGAEYQAEDMKKVQKTDSASQETSSVDNEKIKKTLEKMNAQLSNSEAKFGIHEATNRVMIKLVDKETQEVIKEIPPEKTLDMIAKCMELAGVLVDEKL